MKSKKEEIRLRAPRLVVNLMMVFIFWILNVFVPPTLEGIQIPGVNYPLDQVFWIITFLIIVMFLVKIISDAMILGDILTDAVVGRLGIRGKRSPKRALRDLIYIIVVVLVVAAASPFLGRIENGGGMLSTAVTYIALALIIILIYDIGRIVYELIEEKAEILAEKISRIAKEEEGGKQNT